MTDITFHFNVPNKLDYTCRLLRKAYAAGSKVVVTGESADLARLDQLLWTFSNLEFVPHCTDKASGQVRALSPVFLSASLQETPHQDVLVNIGMQLPEGFERFARLIELVCTLEDDRLSARARWKRYSEGGYQLKRHDCAVTP